jgi:hypothetical protein
LNRLLLPVSCWYWSLAALLGSLGVVLVLLVDGVLVVVGVVLPKGDVVVL